MKRPFAVVKDLFILGHCAVCFLTLAALFAMSSLHAYSQETVLKAGIARTDITPTESLYLAGYDLRETPSDRVYGNIYVRALAFDDSVTQVVFIESDVVYYPDYDVLRRQVSKATGVPFGCIMIGNVHSHSAPAPGWKNADTQWNRQFNDKIVSTAQSALDNLEPVRIGGGVGHSTIAMNRRKRMTRTESYLTYDENDVSQSFGEHKTDNPVKILELEGVIRLGANPDGPIDDEVGILRIDSISGKPKAVFINYACHGTSLGGRNNTVSPEWMGHMLEYVEDKLPGVTGLYAPGAAGDINPRLVGGLDGYQDDLKRTAELGYEIGKEVVDVFNSIKTTRPRNPQIRLAHKDILCPRKYRELFKDFRNTTVAVPTTAIRIDDYVWVTFPGELFHQIGKRIKASTEAKCPFVVTCCNGGVGYLPTQKAFSEGGYEPCVSHLAPVSEPIYLTEVQKLLIKLY